MLGVCMSWGQQWGPELNQHQVENGSTTQGFAPPTPCCPDTPSFIEFSVGLAVRLYAKVGLYSYVHTKSLEIACPVARLPSAHSTDNPTSCVANIQLE